MGRKLQVTGLHVALLFGTAFFSSSGQGEEEGVPSPLETLSTTEKCSAPGVFGVEMKDLKVVMCYVPKGAATKIQQFSLLLMTGMDIPSDTKEGALKIHTLYKSLPQVGENPAILEDPSYLRVAVVRNPFSRLVSAYKDKIENNFQIYKSHQQLRGLPKPTFAEFLRRIRPSAHKETEPHWRLQSCFCHFRTHFNFYDHIIDQQDASLLYDILLKHRPQLKELVPVNPFSTSTFHTTNSSNSSIHSDWSKKPEMVNDVWSHYYEDFIRFGYSFNPSNQSESCKYCTKASSLRVPPPEQRGKRRRHVKGGHLKRKV
eukprot:CAMPEP_0181297524 /NCGR_PEP_ID=MMETSP1101-20121128/5286_1 /TAXON_ID=46948 /ORGANISM="Rhodomonas abbreviata, Strain Caron Lab Isolate" /LENGTH=314 /DNA_ID=CAMNT_0023402467 /DNA_START=104 /DNA_END=1048 /DNA_ORIENTATION=+